MNSVANNVQFTIRMFENIALRFIHYILTLGVILRQWIFRIPALAYKKSEVAVQADARDMKKLPLHLGILFMEDSFSYFDIANAMVWSATMGISYISVYDANGTLKRNEKQLYDAIQKTRNSSVDSELSRLNIRLHTKLDLQSVSDTTTTNVDIFLLSLEDGRQSLVNTARHLCKRVSTRQYRPSDISSQSIDTFLQEASCCPDPDLIVKFGGVESLLGFMPWQVRLTEIMSLPSHIGLDYKTFKSILTVYGDTRQRFGK